MNDSPVIFIAARDYDNLGIGYMSAILLKSGFKSRIIDFRESRQSILKKLKKQKPELIGFSIIFQNHFKQFYGLIGFLKNEGITSHFTAGGHYASLKCEELLNHIPSLDSVVRFEGEYTLLELVRCIYSGRDWKNIEGLAYCQEGKIIKNPIRPLEKDLDNFPFPLRLPLKEYAMKKKFATLISGRGCIYECSFCNTRKFYSIPPGPVKRIRKPEMVIKEMVSLFHKENCSIFLFQDDDFPVRSISGDNWVKVFCHELKRTGLYNKIMWKINCRPDEVDEQLFTQMRDHGLFLVFLGIEDGTDIGLKILNKHLSIKRSLTGINILKRLKIDFDFGFILFHPLTTFKSLRENLEFLRQICGDGYSIIPFQKLVPLYETRAEEELIKEGRLKVVDGFADYDFLEESMNDYYVFIFDSFEEWVRSGEGVENLSKWARNYFAVCSHYYAPITETKKFQRRIRKIISESNIFFLDTLEEMSLLFETKYYKKDSRLLLDCREQIKFEHNRFKNLIIYTMAEFLQSVSYPHFSLIG